MNISVNSLVYNFPVKMSLKTLFLCLALLALNSEAKPGQKLVARRRLFQNVYGIMDGNIKNGDAGDPLILTNLIKEGKIEEARQAAEVKSDIFLGVKGYSGYLRVDDTYSNDLFFWFFPSQSNYEADPLVMWLQGGPGSSSMYGLFKENGPFIINEDRTLSLRNASWSKDNSLLFFDQPAGTGFSTTNNGYAQNQTKVSDDMYAALLQFFTLFPNLQNNEFFITGESYGGKYVPSISHKIFRSNPTADLKINLKGLAIGNGWSVPEYQLRYSEYVYEHGLIDSKVKAIMNELENEAVDLIRMGQYAAAGEVMDTNFGSVFDQAASHIDSYNYLKESDIDGDEDLNEFLSREDVRIALHVGNNPFNQDMNVYNNLAADIPQSVGDLLVDLINNYRVLLYSGQLDIIVAYPMTIGYLQKLNFNGAEDYKRADRTVWFADDYSISGYVKTSGNLTEVLVRNAGHMVPSDQPEVALKLIQKFVRNESFDLNK